MEKLEETLPELEELQNIKERATSYYFRLSRLVVQVAVYQPMASSATLNLLIESIEQTQAIIDAGKANIQEIKKLEFMMNPRSEIPSPETRASSVKKLREVSAMFDQQIMILDELIAQVEADIRNSLIGANKREKGKKILESYSKNKLI